VSGGDSVLPRLCPGDIDCTKQNAGFRKALGVGVHLSADIDMVDLWRDMAIFSSKLEIELKCCLGPLVLRSQFALSKLLVAYRTGCWDGNYYGAVLGH
jgi:hypothetical protein